MKLCVEGMSHSQGIINSVQMRKLLIWGNKLPLCAHQLTGMCPWYLVGWVVYSPSASLCQLIIWNWSERLNVSEYVSHNALINWFADRFVGGCVLKLRGEYLDFPVIALNTRCHTSVSRCVIWPVYKPRIYLILHKPDKGTQTRVLRIRWNHLTVRFCFCWTLPITPPLPVFFLSSLWVFSYLTRIPAAPVLSAWQCSVKPQPQLLPLLLP